MFNQINLDDKVLTSPKFKKDEIPFNIMLTLINKKDNFPEIRCFSDGEDVIILNTDANHPVIVWTSDNFHDFESIYRFITEFFYENEPLSLTAKKSCYLFFQKKGWIANDDNTKILGVYKLDKLNNIKKSGYVDCIYPEDVEIIANMIKSFEEEALPEEKHPYSYYLEQANKYPALRETHKVWKDENGQITSIGHFTTTDSTGKISQIYTFPDKRGKSYAKMLVNELANIILKKNLTPVLYTNFQYEPSNKCYQDVGFKLLDTIYSYSVQI